MLVKQYAKLSNAAVEISTRDVCASCDVNLLCIGRRRPFVTNYCAACHKHWVDIIVFDDRRVDSKTTSVPVHRDCPNIDENMVEDRILEFKLFVSNIVINHSFWKNRSALNDEDPQQSMFSYLVSTCLCVKCARVEAKKACVYYGT